MVVITSGKINSGEKQTIKSIFDPEAIAQLTDRELHKFAQQYGNFSRQAQKEFASFLPEIYKRKLFLKYKFYSIKHYAKVIGGLSEDVVEDILRVNKNLEDKPILQKLIVKQGWSKMKVIASVATPETQEMWAEKVQEMSKSTLETFVRELKKQGDLPLTIADLESRNCKIGVPGNSGILANGKADPAIPDFCPGAENSPEDFGEISREEEKNSRSSLSFKIDRETEKQLRLFRYKLEKQTKQPQDFNTVLKQLLEIAKTHQGCAANGISKTSGGALANSPERQRARASAGQRAAQLIRAVIKQKIKKSINEKSTRAIPAAIEHHKKENSGEMCEYPNCKKPAEISHHLDRFALSLNHDPEKIAVLCKEHERLAHFGLIKNEDFLGNGMANARSEKATTCDQRELGRMNRPDQPIAHPAVQNWSIQINPNKSDPKYKIDQIVNKFRRVV